MDTNNALLTVTKKVPQSPKTGQSPKSKKNSETVFPQNCCIELVECSFDNPHKKEQPEAITENLVQCPKRF